MTNYHFTIKNKGFTLVELLVAISIVAIISAVGFTSYNAAQVRGRDAKRKQDLRSLSVAFELFYQQNRRYPCSNTTLVQSGWQYSYASEWLTDKNVCTVPGSGSKIFPNFINTVPIDPINTTSGSPTTTGVFAYGYMSSNSVLNNCPEGSWYILIAQLENSNDPNRLGGTTFDLCGTTLTNYNTNQFVIKSN